MRHGVRRAAQQTKERMGRVVGRNADAPQSGSSASMPMAAPAMLRAATSGSANMTSG
jgi:hypothetical protein